jgi:regulator of replication initiation timing
LDNLDDHTVKKQIKRFMPINSINAKTIFDKLDAGMDKNRDLFIRNINTTKLKIKSIPELNVLFDMMMNILRSSFKEYVIDKKTSENVEAEFKLKIDIIRTGSVKEEYR